MKKISRIVRRKVAKSVSVQTPALKRRRRAASAIPVEEKRPVTFHYKSTKAHRVFVAGSFNDWSPAQHEMTIVDKGFIINLSLKPGRYEYKFLVDDLWIVDPENPYHVANPLGSLNSVINVK